MALPDSLTVGFTHPPRSQLPPSLGLPSASYFIRELGFLAVGYTSGVIVIFDGPQASSSQHLHAFLTGHHSSIVAFDSLTVRSPTGNDDIILLSLSLDGRICKWEARDGRCLQSVDAILDARPRGLVVVPVPALNTEGNPLEFNWLTDYYVLVYGCSTVVTVLSFTTLSTANLWTGHQDWPVLLPIPGTSHNTIFTIEKSGNLQPWTLTKKQPGRVEMTRIHENPFSVGDPAYGSILSVLLFHDSKEDDECKVLVAQAHGLSLYTCVKSGGIRFSHLKSLDAPSEIKGIAVESQLIFSFTRDGEITVYNDDLEPVDGVSPPKSPDYRIVYYGVRQSASGYAQLVAFVVNNSGTHSFLTGTKHSDGAEFKWEAAGSMRQPEHSKGHPNSTASALFEYNFVYAAGHTLNFYTLDQYLLDLSVPTYSIPLPDHNDTVTILQTIQLGRTAASEDKNYLVVGLANDTDGRKRLWDVDSTDGTALVDDTDSPKSPTFTRDGQRQEDLNSSQEPWREHHLGTSKNGSSAILKSIVQDGKTPSAHGYPTATVDIFAIIRYLHKKTRDTENEQILAPDDSVLLPARSLLTVLVEYLGLLKPGAAGSLNLSKQTGLELEQLLVEGCESKISLAQVGHDGFISITVRRHGDTSGAAWETMSSRTRSQVLLSLCTLVYTILHLTTASEAVSQGDDILRRAVTSILLEMRERKTVGLDLSILAEHWADPNPWIRGSCRLLLEAELSLLAQDDIKTIIEYWQDFLPTQISPELYSLKDVLRSVVVLSVIIVSLDADNQSGFKVDRGLRRNVALSIELFLTDNDKVYQDVAIDLVSEGWLSWQNEFDSFEVIHILMRVLATPNLLSERISRINSAFIRIAEKNAPLLASGLANCISHGAPEKGIASTTLSEVINLSIAAKKTVVSIVRADPYLFAEPEIIKVVMDAVVKVLDPQGGQIRERVLQHVSEVVNEVVDAYPTVAFHRPTQKLAISSSPRSVTIYDLNTAKPVASLEGQTKTAQFLTFSQDGKTIVAADLEESQLLVWKMAVSIFSSFIGAAANIGVLGAEGVGVISAKTKVPFKNSKGVGMIRIEFTGEKTVKVTAGSEVTTVNV
ncbi:hypothetical protein ABW19_dt0202903 [Dactylella cylindrospora]|nr:hypothetical protein ABW19_dt0202903 [Dactylella cylindrospora]